MNETKRCNVCGETKRCCRCGEVKLLSKFSRYKASKDGLQPQCKACDRACMRVYNRANKAKKRAYMRGYGLESNYGISLAEYDSLPEVQGGGCAICGKTPEENGKRLSVDHDHRTGEMRGLLCDRCNLALGGFRDSIELCEQAALYLRLHERKRT